MKKFLLSLLFTASFFFLTARPVAAGFNNGALNSGLVGYWKMDELSGNSVYSTVNGFTGTATGGTTITTGRIGNSRNIPPSWGDYINVPDNSALTNAYMTVAAWINPTSLPSDSNNTYTIIDKRYDWNSTINPKTGYNISLLKEGGVQKIMVLAPNAGSRFAYTLPTNTWSHLAVTFRPGSTSVYVNGSLANTADTGCGGCSIGNYPVPLRFGLRAASGAWPFNGKIDEAGIWNRVLSGGEIGSLAGGDTYCNNTSCVTPSVSNVTISGTVGNGYVKPDNSSQYTISVTGNDGNGAADIFKLYGLINYQGENGGSYRGYLTWGGADYWPSGQDRKSCSGGGYAVIQGGYGNTYLHLDSCSVSGSGNNRTANFVVRFDPSYTTPTLDNDISGYAEDVTGRASGWINFQTNFNLNLVPTINNVTISSNIVVTNNSTQYTITATASDPNGGGDIYGEYALINYQGENGGQYRGYLTWGINNYWPGYQDWHSCSGGGYAAIQPGYGNTYLHLDSCSTSVSGNNRVANFVVRFDPSFTGPSDNDISGYVWDSLNQANGWTNFQTNFGLCPATVSISGNISSIPSGQTSAAYAGSYQSNNVNTPQGAYSVSVPSIVGGGSYQVYAKQISGYSPTPGPTATSVSCSNVTGPNFTYYQNACTATPDTALSAVWHMDETSGQTVADSSGNNNNGTATGTTIVSGKYGNARSLNGTSDYIGVTNPSVPIGNSSYTMAAWIKPNAMGTYGIIGWGNYGTVNQVNAFRLTSTGLTNYWWGNDLTVATSDLSGSWHYVTATFDGTTRIIYVDGTVVGSDTPTGHNVPNSANFRIGSTNNGEYFPGAIDEVRIWNRALAAWEVAGEAQQLCCTGVKVNCGTWSGCQNPQGVDITCGTGNKYRSCYDSGCSNPIADTPQYCVVQIPITISDGISNAGQQVTVCAANTGGVTGATCTNNVCSSSSQTNYSVTVPSLCDYELSSSAISGYSVAPDDYKITSACTNMTGPRFWYLSGAGIVGAGTTINPGSGYISQAGTPPPPAGPGLNLQNYNSQTPLSKVNYSEFLKAVLKNARSGSPLTKTELEGQANCQSGSGLAMTTTNTNIGNTGTSQSFDWYCYTNATGNLDSQLSAAISAASTNVKILYPYQFTSTVTATAKTLAAGDNIITFVPGTLQVDGNITVPATANNASAVFILDAGGDLNVKSTVSELDGLYVFPGAFNDNYESIIGNNLLLSGLGALIGTGTSSWTLQRTVPESVGPAESWTYQPKYLTIYNNIFSIATYTWQELPPQ